ncbi:hypothetical protein D9619_001344 [Psilocybe cf. subviscida]|uniref:Cytochrome P450 n=1 Tax=Psilocybe cf. subviscida TaxID=2480587 RepID=A0A8H5F2N2_9AGAR|nr:hypothetical protein D9619_001344 [Psilocybe cf. subviscida]
MPSLVLFAFSFGLLFLVRRFLAYRQAVAAINHHPGSAVLLSSANIIGRALPRIKYLAAGSNSLFVNKYEAFERAGCDVISRSALLPLRVALDVADAAVIKEVTSSRARFPKPVHYYKVLTFFGRNIIASEGEEWKKYRKISAPAFSDRNNALVWSESVKTVKEMFTDLWMDRDVITVDHCVNITLPIALFIIGAAGFGRRISWKEDVVVPEGYTMSFKDALHTVASDTFLKVIVPESLLGITKRTRNCRDAFTELRNYMATMIHERQNAEKIERHDLFSSLLDANNDSLGSGVLTESELIGNIYIFLLAGHETTAHTLCFTFALLALYPDEQEKLYQHIKKTIPEGEEPTYEQMPLLTYSNAVFYETLRMFPPVVGIPKVAAEDTSITTQNVKGESVTIPVPKGTDITLDTPALHYSPRYWKDPHQFNPSRFLDSDWPRDAFLPFSSGARACIGRKFFETEGIAILTTLARNFKITVKAEPQFAIETFDQRKARVLDARAGLTLTPKRVPLTFTRRK